MLTPPFIGMPRIDSSVALRGGISRSIKCDDSLAIVETYEETKSDRIGQHCPHG